MPLFSHIEFMRGGFDMKKGKLIGGFVAILFAAIYYYLALPAINIHSKVFGNLFYW